MHRLSLVLLSTILPNFAHASEKPIDPLSSSTNSIQCYELPHGKNGMGSSNTVAIPPFYAYGNYNFELFVTNTGDKPINVSLQFFDESGNLYYPDNGLVYSGAFADTNGVIKTDLDNDGIALLRPLNSGYVKIRYEPEMVLSGRITWQADECLSKPTVSVTGNFGFLRNAIGIININGGMPF